jgi:mannose-6-phosphate isomerase-like protein (cupin superfamily)
MNSFTDYREHVGSDLGKFFKTTLFHSNRLLLGLNCLELGQVQEAHSHDDQDKFYFVLEGEGEFVVGEETRRAGPGTAVWAPAGIDHGVSNRGTERLVILMGMAPAPGRKA